MMNRLLMALLAASALLAGCGKSDCRTYCEKYQECVDAKTVVDDCTNSCESRNTNSADHQSRAKACADCVSPKTCSEATSSCFSLCFAL